jgi:hypothetical protein
MRTSRRAEQAYHLKSSSGHHADGRGTGADGPAPGASLSTERAGGGRLSRAWRAMRGTGPVGTAAERCGASGWHLSSGCLDGNGVTICPLCGQRVPTVRRARVPRGVEVVEAHGA